MSVLDQISSALKRRDEEPNIMLASRIAAANDEEAVAVLVAAMQNRPEAVRQDCIKVLYEIAERNPKLVAKHSPVFIPLLRDKNNRMQWSAMHTLRNLTDEVPVMMYEALPLIVEAATVGSVITRDNAVHIMAKLCANKTYEENIFPLLLEQLLSCPENQLPMYAELIATVISKDHIPAFIQAVNTRAGELEKETKKQRLMKLLKKLSGS